MTEQSEIGAIGRGTNYLSESFEELKKVHTPTKQETFQATLVTFVIVTFISLTVALMDLIFGWITTLVL